jgi:hypothetical protein
VTLWGTTRSLPGGGTYCLHFQDRSARRWKKSGWLYRKGGERNSSSCSGAVALLRTYRSHRSASPPIPGSERSLVPECDKTVDLPYKSRYPISVKAQFNGDNIRDGGRRIPVLLWAQVPVPSVFRLQRPCDGTLLHPRSPTACQQIHYLTAEFSLNF